MVLFKKLCSRAFLFGLFRGEERKVRTASIGPNAEMARKGTTKVGDLHLDNPDAKGIYESLSSIMAGDHHQTIALPKRVQKRPQEG